MPAAPAINVARLESLSHPSASQPVVPEVPESAEPEAKPVDLAKANDKLSGLLGGGKK